MMMILRLTVMRFSLLHNDEVIFLVAKKKKKWYESYTLWVNIALFTVAVIDAAKDLGFVRPEYLVFAGTIVNAGLRIWKTEHAIE